MQEVDGSIPSSSTNPLNSVAYESIKRVPTFLGSSHSWDTAVDALFYCALGLRVDKMRASTAIKISWIVGCLLLTATLLIRAYVLLATPVSAFRRVAEFIYDDGYYYLTIAANLADTGRSTFDGITSTNGYQPLWLMVLTLLAKLVGTDKHTFFICACLLTYTVVCAAPLLALLQRDKARRDLLLCFGAGLAIVVLQQPMVFIEGLEPVLFAPVAMVLVVLLESAETSLAAMLRLSATLAVAFLIRLDALALWVAIGVVLPAWQVFQKEIALKALPAQVCRVTLRLGVLVMPVVAGYLLINAWLFGSAVPVSGLAKAIGGARFANWGVVAAFFSRWATIAMLVAILSVLEFVAHCLRLRVGSAFYRSLIVMVIAIAAQAFYYAAFSAWYLWPWYTYLVALCVALIMARIILLACSLLQASQRQIFAPSIIRITSVAALGAIGLWGCRAGLALVRASTPDGASAGAQQVTFNQISLDMLADFFPPGRHTVVAMGDRAGGLAYWGRGQVSVVQTEGLTLDVGYLKARSMGGGARYLEHFPIQYLVTDREVLPVVADPDGKPREYVVPDPIQGRINKGTVPTFCFPPEAVRYARSYETDLGANARIAFLFSLRRPCSDRARVLVHGIEQGVGLRQYSLPGEYVLRRGEREVSRMSLRNKGSEDLDRRHVTAPTGEPGSPEPATDD